MSCGSRRSPNRRDHRERDLKPGRASRVNNAPRSGIALLVWALILAGACSRDDADDTRDPRRKALRLFVFPREVEPLGEATLAIETEACDGCFVCVRAGEEGRGRVLAAPAALISKEPGLVIVPAGAVETLTSLVFRAPNREGSDVIAASLVDPEASPCEGRLVDTTTARVITRRAPVPVQDEKPDAGPEETDGGPPEPPPPAMEDAGPEPADASDGE